MPSWAIGAVINVAGGVVVNLGTNLVKLGYTQAECAKSAPPPDVSPSDGSGDPHPSPGQGGGDARPGGASGGEPAAAVARRKPGRLAWSVGISLFLLGNVLNFASFAFAAQSLLAALTSVQFVANLFFARWINGERPTRRVLVATAAVVGGCVVLVAFGNHADESLDVHDLLRLYRRSAYVGYAPTLAVACLAAAATHLLLSRRREAEGGEGAPPPAAGDVAGCAASAPDSGARAGVTSTWKGGAGGAEASALKWGEADESAPLSPGKSDMAAEGGDPAALVTRKSRLGDLPDETPNGLIAASPASRAWRQGFDAGVAPALGGESARPGGRIDPHGPPSTVRGDGSRGPPSTAEPRGTPEKTPPSTGSPCPPSPPRPPMARRRPSQRPWGRQVGALCYAFSAAGLGTQSVVFGKAVAALLRTTLAGRMQLGHWYTYVALLVFIVTAVSWTCLFNGAMKRFPVATMMPLLMSFWVLLSMVSGGIYYDEFSEFSRSAFIAFAVGTAVLLVGIYLLIGAYGANVEAETERADEAAAAPDGSSEGTVGGPGGSGVRRLPHSSPGLASPLEPGRGCGGAGLGDSEGGDLAPHTVQVVATTSAGWSRNPLASPGPTVRSAGTTPRSWWARLHDNAAFSPSAEAPAAASTRLPPVMEDRAVVKEAAAPVLAPAPGDPEFREPSSAGPPALAPPNYRPRHHRRGSFRDAAPPPLLLPAEACPEVGAHGEPGGHAGHAEPCALSSRAPTMAPATGRVGAVTRGAPPPGSTEPTPRARLAYRATHALLTPLSTFQRAVLSPFAMPEERGSPPSGACSSRPISHPPSSCLVSSRAARGDSAASSSGSSTPELQANAFAAAARRLPAALSIPALSIFAMPGAAVLTATPGASRRNTGDPPSGGRSSGRNVTELGAAANV